MQIKRVGVIKHQIICDNIFEYLSVQTVILTFCGLLAIGGAALVLLSLALIFDFTWGSLWPLLLIAVGLGVLLRTYWH